MVFDNILKQTYAFAPYMRFKVGNLEQYTNLHVHRENYKPENIFEGINIYWNALCNTNERSVTMEEIKKFVLISEKTPENYRKPNIRVSESNLHQKEHISFSDYNMVLLRDSASKNRVFFEPMDMLEVDNLRCYLRDQKIITPMKGETSINNYTREVLQKSKEITSIMTEMILSDRRGNRSRNRASDRANSIADLRTLATEMTTIPLTPMTLDRYYWNRHEVVSSFIMDTLGLTDGSTDVDLREKFNYTGMDCQLTPDMLVETDNRVLFLEVAVTSGSTSEVLNNKIDKYKRMISGLSSFLETEVLFDCIIFNVSEPDSSYTAAHNLLDPEWTVRMSHRLKVMEDLLKQMPTYNSVKERMRMQMGLRNEDEVDLELNMSSFLEKFSAYFSLKEKKAYTITDSHTLTDSMISENFVQNSMDELVRKMDDSMTLEEMEENLVWISAKIKSMSVEKERGKKIRSMVTFDNSDFERVASNLMSEGIRVGTEQRQLIKVPKIFKYPVLELPSEKLIMPIPIQGSTMYKAMEDGTKYYFKPRGFKLRENERQVENTKGIGLSEEDEEVIESLVADMSDESSYSFRILMANKYPKERETLLCRLKIMEVAWMVSMLCKNLCYLEGRRMIEKGKYVCCKYFEDLGYSLLIAPGSRLTTEKQINYMIRSRVSNMDIAGTHGLVWDEKDLCYSTGWLSISSSDLKTGSMMFEKMMSLGSYLMDNWEESEKVSIEGMEGNLKSSIFVLPMMVLLEARRPTSTTLQYNRYILHSSTALISDKFKMLEDIMADPVRNRMEAYIRVKQFKWALELCRVSKDIMKEAFLNHQSLDSDYDLVRLPTFFNPSTKMEFCWVINDIYLCNLLNKEMGFKGHRVKSIMEKTAKEEVNFLKVRGDTRSMGELKAEEAFESNNTNHLYNADFVSTMGKLLSEKLLSTGMMSASILSSMCDNILSAMMTTTSLKSGPITLSDKEFQTTVKVEKDMSFSTIYEKVKEIKTSVLVGMVERLDGITAIFSMFPKAQIGGPREILIQWVTLRVAVKLFETISKNLCQLHEKEMLTKGEKKESIQSDSYFNMKERMMSDRRNGEASFVFALNADASRWAPAFTMDVFCNFLKSIPMEENVKEFMVTLIRSFSCKYQFLPEELAKKWKRAPNSRVEQNNDLEYLRRNLLVNDDCCRIFSGMGQGMLHYFSSLLHCAKDDMHEEIFKRAHGDTMLDYRTVTMISSDDLYKIVYMKPKKPEMISTLVTNFLLCYNCTNRMSDIHMNLKKSALQLLIFEFNSYFTTGKRGIKAVVKDIFTMMEVPDLTSPEQAVREMFSNLQRSFSNGMYMPTMEMSARLMREWILDVYKIDTRLTKSLTSKLSCKEEDLPIELGYFPINNLMECMVFGLDIRISNPKISETLKCFYKGLFSAKEQLMTVSMEDLEADRVPILGKFRLELPVQMDKRMQEYKKGFKQKYNVDEEELMLELDKLTLLSDENVNLPACMSVTMDSYLFGIKKKYAFSETYYIHSLIRALQLSGKRLEANPKVEGWKELGLEETVDMMLLRANKKTMFHLLHSRDEVWKCIDKAQSMISDLQDSTKGRHTKSRNIGIHTGLPGTLAKPTEILDYIFGRKKDFTSRVLDSVKGLCEILEMDQRELLINPIKTITNLLDGSKMPLMDFKRFIVGNYKADNNTMVRIMSSFPESGQMLNTLMNLYMDRLKPMCVMALSTESMSTDMEKDLSTYFTFFSDEKVLLDGLDMTESEMTQVNPSDSNILKGIKVYKCVKGNLEDSIINPSKVYYSKRYSGNSQIVSYYDFNSLADLVILNNKVTVRYRYKEAEDLESNLFKALEKDLELHRSEGKTVEFMGTNRLENMRASRMTARHKVWVDFMQETWIMKLGISLEGEHEMSERVFKLCSGTYMSYRDSFDRLCNFEKMSQVSSLMYDSLDLKQVERMCNSLNWINDITVKRVEMTNNQTTQGQTINSDEDDMAAFLQDMTAGFGMSMFTDSNVNLNTDMEDVDSMQEEPETNEMETGDQWFDVVNQMKKMMSENRGVIRMKHEKFDAKMVMRSAIQKAVTNRVSVNRRQCRALYKNSIRRSGNSKRFWCLFLSNVNFILRDHSEGFQACVYKTLASNLRRMDAFKSANNISMAVRHGMSVDSKMLTELADEDMADSLLDFDI